MPGAAFNYLLRPSRERGDDEAICREEAIQRFDIDAVEKSPSRLDLRMMENLNGYCGRTSDDTRLAEFEAARLAFDRAGWQCDLPRRSMAKREPRAANPLELSDGPAFLFRTRPPELDEAAAVLLEGDARGLLARIDAALDAAESWDTEALEAAVRTVADDAGGKLGQVAQPLRAARTGRRTSPGIFDVPVPPGREESPGRIANQSPCPPRADPYAVPA